MIRGLLFDLDGLLFDSEKIVQRSWNQAGQEMGYGNVGEHIYNTIGINFEKRKEYFASAFGADFPHDQFRERTREIFWEITNKEGIYMKEGAKELICYAKQMGYKIAVVTSSSGDYAEGVLKSKGIYQYFDGFVYGNMVKKSKPDPEAYATAAKILGLRPEYCVAFEDAPAGVLSATGAGIDTIMVPDLIQPDEEIKSRAWKIIERLDDAIELLRLEARG